MNPLLERIRRNISPSSLLSNDTTLVIGVSGGGDSIALLHILSVLFPASKRIAVYVDHGLRPLETSAEIDLVQKQAKICCAYFEKMRVDVQAEKVTNHCSLEEAARTLRYQALEEIRSRYKACSIAVGHTANDQAEEVLIRLIRGSGTAGLSGMKQRNGYIIRPLLNESKKSLRHYLEEQHITFCEDSSNLDTRFLRNRVRLELLPTLERDYNTAMKQTLLQTAAVLRDEDQLLAQLTADILPTLIKQEPETITLDLPLFTSQPVAIQRRILDTICWTLHSKPSFKKIQSLLELSRSKDNKEIHLTGGLRAIHNSNTILFHHPSSKEGYRGPGIIPKTFSPITIPGPGTYPVPELNHTLTLSKRKFSPNLLKVPDTLILDATKVCFPLLLRQPQKADSFHPLGAPGSKKISRFLSDKKIPAMERSHYPLLLSGSEIIALTGLRIDDQFQITARTTDVLILEWYTN